MDSRSLIYLAGLARRVENDPFFVASVLREYAHGEGLTEADLAARLGIPEEDLDRLRLCRCPDPAAPDFRRDLERIAAHTGAQPGVLAQIIRQVASLNTLRQAEHADGGLRAARDREPTGDEAPEAE